MYVRVVSGLRKGNKPGRYERARNVLYTLTDIRSQKLGQKLGMSRVPPTPPSPRAAAASAQPTKCRPHERRSRREAGVPVRTRCIWGAGGHRSRRCALALISRKLLARPPRVLSAIRPPRMLLTYGAAEGSRVRCARCYLLFVWIRFGASVLVARRSHGLTRRPWPMAAAPRRRTGLPKTSSGTLDVQKPLRTHSCCGGDSANTKYDAGCQIQGPCQDPRKIYYASCIACQPRGNDKRPQSKLRHPSRRADNRRPSIT